MGSALCPCGSGVALQQCCGRYHGGEAVPSAEALMRSRYSAYVLRDSDYLHHTWHSCSRPEGLEIGNDDISWLRLQIIATEKGGEGDSEGSVEFAAYYHGGQLHERSRFVREAGAWRYLDGELLPPLREERVGRNTPCPCGSGKKFKRCCG